MNVVWFMAGIVIGMLVGLAVFMSLLHLDWDKVCDCSKEEM